MTATPEQQAVLESFNALSDEAKVGLLEKTTQRFGTPVTGEVKWGASMPGEIPPSGEMDPVTGAPVKAAAEGEPPAPQPQPVPPAPPPGAPPPYVPPPPGAPPPTTATRTTTTTVRR